jgi:steroid 5-alpha reductase family enzyme
MWKTVVLLILTLIVIPIIAFSYDEALTTEQEGVLHLLLSVYLATALFTFLVSSLSRNYSQVDKLWSIMPVIYTWIVAVKGNYEPRLVLMSVLVTFWGIRLTYNFNRRGGYSWKFWSGEEDYRWSILRAKPEFKAGWKWALFNLFFISLYQMALILLFTLPVLRAMEGRPISFWDFILAGLFLLFLAIETLSDQQQWNYHKEKHRRKNTGEALGEKYQRGFVREGWWARMRHPNYASEQAIWATFYFFSIVATGIWLNWSIVGILLLMLLFYSSSEFSENVSSGKYPEYEDYKKNVGRFLPKL